MTFTKILKKTFKNIAENKLLSILLFVLHLVIILFLSYKFFGYAIDFLTYTNDISQTLQGLTPSADLNSLIQNQAGIMEIYSKITAVAIGFASWVLLICLTVNAFNWIISSKIAGNNKNPFKSILTFDLLFLIFMVPFVFLIFLFSSAMFDTNFGKAMIFIFILLLLAVKYFFYISFALSNKETIKNSLKNCFKTGYNNANILVPVFLIAMIIPAVILLLIALNLEQNFALLLSLVALFILSLAFGKIYFSTAMSEIK